jgi:hypothetical protein
MNTTKKAMAVLTEAEGRLRELVGQAAAAGEYDAAMRMATVAKSLSALAGALNGCGTGAESGTSGAASGAVGTAGISQPSGMPLVKDDQKARELRPSAGSDRRGKRVGSRRVRGRKGKRPSASARARAPRKGVYPKFFREGDWLVKVAWSKKDRGEYQHKAPRRVGELLVAAIARQAQDGGLFTSEDIFPLKDPQGGEVPSYQAYAALAWLRQAGLVQAHGRRGYTVKDHGRLPELLTAAWESLSEASD